jgi:hypothetical protein
VDRGDMPGREAETEESVTPMTDPAGSITTRTEPGRVARDGETMTTTTIVLSLSLLMASAACSVHDDADGPTPSGTMGFLAVISGVDDLGLVSGTMELDVTDTVTGTARVRGGDGVSTEYDVEGSVSGGTGQLAWGGYSASFQLDGTSFDGTFDGPSNGAGQVAGTLSDLGTGQVLCGTYDGDDAGVWNFVVSDAGSIRGAFSGWVAGTLSGSVSGGQVAMQWSAGEDLAGGAQGTLQGNRAMGGWSGSDLGGTWASDESVCP